VILAAGAAPQERPHFRDTSMGAAATYELSVTQNDFQPISPHAEHTSSHAARTVSVGLATYAIAGSLITLAGWAFNLPRLTDWNDEGIAMFPNAALCAVMGGVALVLRGDDNAASWRRNASRVLAACVTLIGSLTLFEHITGINLGIDTLLSDKTWGQRASAALMRMGPPASVSYLILGSAIMLTTLGSESRRFAGELALLVIAIAFLSLTGYLFGADQLFGIAHITGIAWQTSTMLAALSIAVMASVPQHGIVAALRRDDVGGIMLRRLIVPIVVVPLGLGWLRLLGQEAGLYDLEFGTAVRSVVEILLLFGLLWWTANGISEQARVARLAQEAAKRADRRKDEFLATLAHELRNPLAPIGNALQLLQHSEGDSGIQLQALDTMQRQFSKMVRLVDDLLDVGRITRDKLELRKARTELKPVILQAVETSRALPEGTGQRLRVDLPPEPIWVDADPVRLSQVFSNLITNACKFSEPGGTIVIAAERDDHEVVVTVSDSGIGIAPDKLSRIFEMFEQVDNSLERTRGGLGIGLTLVKRLVELHGGTITARSEGLGRGSQFSVRLAMIAEEASPVPAAPDTGGASSKARRILVTDDNRDAANSLAMLLKLSGHQVDTAYDGIEAVQKAEAHRPEVILLDIGLPGKNGYEVCRTIRQAPWGKDIRIVAVTGWGQEQDRRNTREAGFDHHLMKPVTVSALDEALAS
jgi:signal transduction histidine kinase